MPTIMEGVTDEDARARLFSAPYIGVKIQRAIENDLGPEWKPEDIAARSYEEWLRVPNVGPKNVQHLRDWLKAFYGLEFGGEPDGLVGLGVLGVRVPRSVKQALIRSAKSKGLYGDYLANEIAARLIASVSVEAVADERREIIADVRL